MADRPYWVIRTRSGEDWGGLHDTPRGARGELARLRRSFVNGQGMGNLMPNPEGFDVVRVGELERVDRYLCGTGQHLKGCDALPDTKLVWECGCRQVSEWVCSWHGRMAKLGQNTATPCEECDVPPVLVSVETRIKPAKLPDFYRDRDHRCWLCHRPGTDRMAKVKLPHGSKVPVCADYRECRVDVDRAENLGYARRDDWVIGVRERGHFYQIGSDVDRTPWDYTFREPDGRPHTFTRSQKVLVVTGRRVTP